MVIPAKKIHDGMKIAGRRASPSLGVGEANSYTRLIPRQITSQCKGVRIIIAQLTNLLMIDLNNGLGKNK